LSIAQAARKIGKTDLYRTPEKAIIPLYMILKNERGKNILDPCEGDGRIRRKLESIDPSNQVIGFDLFPDFGKPVDFLEHSERYDYIVGNPPFSVKNEFINHALEISRFVIFLLPMSVVSYNIFHREFLDRPEYVGRLLMTPKMFLNSEGTFKPGGTDSYAWFVWDNEHKSRGSVEHYFDLRKL